MEKKTKKDVTSSTTNNKQKEDKNKKKKILMGTLIPIGALAVTAAIVAPTVIACKNKGDKIEVSLDTSSSEGVKISSSDIQKGKNSTITLELPDGKEIDTLEIKVGGKALTKGTDYTVDGNKITINGTVVDGNKISLKVVTKDKAIVTGVSVNPTSLSKTAGETVKETDIKVTLTYSDTTTKENAKQGTDYKVYKVVDEGESFITLPYTVPAEAVGKEIKLKVKAVKDETKFTNLTVNVVAIHSMTFNEDDGYTSDTFEVASKSTVICDMNIAADDKSQPYIPKTFTLEEQTGNGLIPISSITSVLLDNEEIKSLCTLSDNKITFDLSSKTLTNKSKIRMVLVTNNDVIKQAKALCEPISHETHIEFVSDNAFSLQVYDDPSQGFGKGWDGTVQYSTDGSGWDEWKGDNEIPAVQKEGKYYLYLRGKNNTVMSGTDGMATTFIFSGGDNPQVSFNGNIMTLLDWENPNTVSMGDYCFSFLFYQCKNLVSIPKLPAKKLSDSCYYYMFGGCTGLTSIPENLLPATELAKGCYNNMFRGCTGLTTLPQKLLPVTELKDYCYQGMFIYCENLTQSLELPATTLVDSCYADMFSHCYELKSVSKIGNTEGLKIDGNQACNQMFYDCRSLKVVESTSSAEKWFMTVKNINPDADNPVLAMFNDCAAGSITEPEAGKSYKYVTE